MLTVQSVALSHSLTVHINIKILENEKELLQLSLSLAVSLCNEKSTEE